jgi:nickel transport protein
MKMRYFIPLLVMLGGVPPAIAHGSSLDVSLRQSVEITATYESGDPMDEAQVSVYAPDDLETPWQTGLTDDQGRFQFVPDQAGQWDVKVRKAGHGSLVTVPVNTTTTTEASVASVASESSSYSPAQKGMMAIAIVWGCVGTALFFTRKPIKQ